MLVGDAYTNDGIPTYVVGINISNVQSPNAADGEPSNIIPSMKLDEVAQAGRKINSSWPRPSTR